MGFSILIFTVILLLLFFLTNNKLLSYIAFFLVMLFGNGYVSNYLMKTAENNFNRIYVNSLEPTDVIIVLSGGFRSGVKPNYIPEWTDSNRFFGAIDLFLVNPSALMVFTNAYNVGDNNNVSEGQFYQLWANKLGVSNSNIYITKNVTNTCDEVKEIKKTLHNINKNKEIKNITLVTSAFHMRRAIYIFKYHGFNVNFFAVDVKSNEDKFNHFNLLYFLPNIKNIDKSEIAIRELIAQILYESHFLTCN